MIVAQIALSQAHTPFFTQREKIILPDGQVGEMRLLHGDGIIGPNPIRVIVLDGGNRLIGYSEETFSPHTIICSADRKCAGYRHSDNMVLEFVASKSYVGPIVTDGLSTGLWGDRGDQVNISMRPPKFSEFGFANYRLMTLKYFFILPIAIFGMLMGVPLLILWHWVIGSRHGIIYKIVCWIAALGAELVLLVWSLFAAFVTGDVSVFAWLVSVCIGILCTFAFARLLRPPRQAALT